MTVYADQRDRIKVLGETVTDIGRVHSRPRYGDFAEHYQVGTAEGFSVPHVRAWEIGLADEGIKTSRVTGGGYRHRRRHWIIRGYVHLGDDDAANDPEHPGTPAEIANTYTTIIELAEGFADAIDGDPTLAGTCLFIHDEAGNNAVAITDPNPLMLGGGILTWGIALTFATYSEIAP